MNESTNDEVSSCQELEEKRQQAENAALEAAQQRIDVIIRHATAQEASKLAEKTILEEELVNETRSLTLHKELLEKYSQSAREQLHEMLKLQGQLTKVNEQNVRMQSLLQELRVRNHAALLSDPIFIMLREENNLRQQLQEMGVKQYAPACSEEYGYLQ